jgi:hypothetical protein
MKKVILEFTLNGHKHTYFRRVDMFGSPVTTTNRNSARKVKESEVPGIVKLLIKEHGKNNVTDVNPISGDE